MKSIIPLLIEQYSFYFHHAKLLYSKENDVAMLLYKSRDEDGSTLYEIVASRARHDSHCDFCVTYANFMVCHGRSSPKDKEPHRERRGILHLDGAVDSLPAALLRKPLDPPP